MVYSRITCDLLNALLDSEATIVNHFLTLILLGIMYVYST